jgi:HSP20 family protein
MKLTRRIDKREKESGWIEHGFDLPGMFDDFVTRDFLRPTFSRTGVSTPAVNIIETNDDFMVEMVAPGMKKEAFKVELNENILTVSYDHEDNREGERQGWKYTTHEYNYHSFSRSFSLPDTVDAERTSARYENGILNLIIPKKDEARSKPSRRISIS